MNLFLIMLLILTGCNEGKNSCVKTSKVVKIYEGGFTSVIELENGEILSTGNYVRVGKDFCIKWEN